MTGHQDLQETMIFQDFSESTIHEGCATINTTDMETIFTTMQEDWPVIVYNKNNIS